MVKQSEINVALREISSALSERITVLETHVQTIKKGLDEVTREVISIRKALWFLGMAMLLNGGPNLEKLVAFFLKHL